MQSFMELWQEIMGLFDNYSVSQFASSFCARSASNSHTEALRGLCTCTYSMSTPVISLLATSNMRCHQCWISMTVYAFWLASRERPHTHHGEIIQNSSNLAGMLVPCMYTHPQNLVANG